MIEAILPKKAVGGFSSTYKRIKGGKISSATPGVYIHPDPDVDKWGAEMRVTLRASPSELTQLDFGRHAYAVDDPARPRESYRINNNGYVWDILRLGFELGSSQSVSQIQAAIPTIYLDDFRNGMSKAV